MIKVAEEEKITRPIRKSAKNRKKIKKRKKTPKSRDEGIDDGGSSSVWYNKYLYESAQEQKGVYGPRLDRYCSSASTLWYQDRLLAFDWSLFYIRVLIDFDLWLGGSR